MGKIIICILCLTPNETYLEFISLLNNEKYNVYICVDNNKYIPNKKWLNKLNFIQLDNITCENAGYNSLVGYFNNKACSKDKALYYFNNNNIDFEYIWFIEDDTFIPSLVTIKNIDCKYPNYDMLSPKISHENIHDWYWGPKLIYSQFYLLLKQGAEGVIRLSDKESYSYFDLKYPFRLQSMTCAIRLSKNFMTKIHNFASNYKRLFMDELFFLYIANVNNLRLKVISELEETIAFRYRWKIQDININNLYHPIKNYYLQKYIREKIHNSKITNSMVYTTKKKSKYYNNNIDRTQFRFNSFIV